MLVVSLIFLVIMTIVGIFMFSGLTQDQRMSGNFREKTRAVDATQASLNYIQYFLAQPGNAYLGPNNWAPGAACVGTSTAPVICNAAQANPTTLPWGAYSSYTPPGMTVASSGENMYTSGTSIYTNFIGVTSANPPSALYQATVAAKGGNDTATAVVRSVFKVTATSIDLGGG